MSFCPISYINLFLKELTAYHEISIEDGCPRATCQPLQQHYLSTQLEPTPIGQS